MITRSMCLDMSEVELEAAAEKGMAFSAELIRKLCELYGVEEFYEDFDNCGRWAITQFHIVQFTKNGQYWRFWHSVALTEARESEWYNQKPVCVAPIPITKKEWIEI